MSRLLFLLFTAIAPLVQAFEPLVLSGTLTEDGPAFELVTFEVPEGVVEIEVRHSDDSARNVIDFGLRGPDGFRGWGGGNAEPAIVGLEAASRSYLPGPMAGAWQLVFGKASILEPPARWEVEILLREEATLPVDPDRAALRNPQTLSTTKGWYAGDLHVHSVESGDARPKLDEVATFARGRGLDFVALSDHNTVSQVDFIERLQARHPQLLFVPSVEFTTYSGHGNAIGATRPVSHLMGVDTDILQAVEAFEAQQAVFGVNHPVLALGSLCIGCAWEHELPPERIGTVEIGTGGWDMTGLLFGDAALAFWDGLLDRGSRAAPVGGSDDHQAGQGTGQFASPIGNPTTMVFADSLSWPAIVEGVRRGRTVVKLQGPADPMVELTLGDAMIGDEVFVESASVLKVVVTGGEGHALRLVVDGGPEDEVEIDTDPFVLERTVAQPAKTQRWRAEVLVEGHPRTVTGHVWVSPAPAGEDGCGCASDGPGAFVWLLLGLVRRRQTRP